LEQKSPSLLYIHPFFVTMSSKIFALFCVLCFALGCLAQLDDSDQVAVYDQNSLSTTIGANVTSWTNDAPSAAGTGDLTIGGGSVTIQQCGIVTGASFDGASYFTTAFPAVTISATETVVVIVVAKSTVGVTGRQGVISTSSETNIQFTEGSVGPGAFISGTEYYEDAEDATIGSGTNVARTSGLSTGDVVALGFVYQPNADTTDDDYVVINGPTFQPFTGTAAAVQTTGALATVNVGFRSAGADANQHFTGCVLYLAIYISSGKVLPLDVALTVGSLANAFGTSGSTPGNSTVVPSKSPVSRTTTTGRRSTTSRASTTTTGRRGSTTTGRRRTTVTTNLSAASLPFVAPAIQALFLVVVSAFLFFMW